MEIHLKIIGCCLIVLALIHVIFPRYFNWAEELRSLSLINRQMMQVHTFFIALMVLLMGSLCLSSSTELLTTALGRKIALGLGIFWGIRLLAQGFVYDPALWKGKRFETIVHLIFTCFWAYLTIVFLWIYWH
ncbi:MAG: hypothetical protein AAGD05_18200 [Bacteroidota bacterium]